MEDIIPKESLGEQQMFILQGLKDSKEHFSAKSVLNPLQNNSGNPMSAWPCPCRLPGFTAWWMLTSARRHPVRDAAGAMMDCTLWKRYHPSLLKRLPVLRDGWIPTNPFATSARADDGMHTAGTCSFLALPGLRTHLQQNLLFSCAWLAIEQDTPASITGDAQSAKIFKNWGQKSKFAVAAGATTNSFKRRSLFMSDHTKVTTKSSRRQTAKQAGWGELSSVGRYLGEHGIGVCYRLTWEQQCVPGKFPA